MLGKGNKLENMQASWHDKKVCVNKLTWHGNIYKQNDMIKKTNQYDKVGKSIRQHVDMIAQCSWPMVSWLAKHLGNYNYFARSIKENLSWF
jgi:hypothetical protein